MILGTSNDAETVAAVAQALAAIGTFVAVWFAARSARAAESAAKATQAQSGAALTQARAAAAQLAPVIVAQWVKNDAGIVRATLKNAGAGPGVLSNVRLHWNGGPSGGLLAAPVDGPTLAPGWWTYAWFQTVPPPNLMPLSLTADVSSAAAEIVGLDALTSIEQHFRWDHGSSLWRNTADATGGSAATSQA